MEEKKLVLRDFYGEDIELIAAKTAYANNGRLAVLLFEDDGELFCDLTVNIDWPQSDPKDGSLAFIDTNTCPFIERFVLESGLGYPTGHKGRSGYCVYPEFRLNAELMVDLKEVPQA